MLSMVLNEVAPPPPPPSPPTSTAITPAPRFPTYLLPGFSRPVRPRRQSSISGNSTPAQNDIPSLSNSPTDSALSTDSPTVNSLLISGFSFLRDGLRRTSTEAADAPKLTRIQPDTIRCSTCGTDFALCSQIVSKGFTGRYGRAYLVSPPENPPNKSGANLMNIKIGKPETRILVTGTHVVCDIQCATCRARVGWKYVDAKEDSQKYKIGKFIIETERTVDHRNWEDIRAVEMPEFEWEQKDPYEGSDGEPVLFDSDDSDDCDDLFAGVWDPKIAAKRRKHKVIRGRH